jgi:hypothetical protein
MTETTQDDVTRAAANIVDHAAAALHQLIQRSPQSPSKAEIAEVLEAALRESVADEEVGDLLSDAPASVIDFTPALGQDGKPVQFEFTNAQFADAFCPWIRMAFVAVGRDREGVAEMVRELATGDHDARLLFNMLRSWDCIESKFGALAGIALSAWARVMAVTETLMQEDSDVGRALSRGADTYLPEIEERQGARQMPAAPSA